nr:hypothetical protein [Tanacetum cinerariifolium]
VQGLEYQLVAEFLTHGLDHRSLLVCSAVYFEREDEGVLGLDESILVDNLDGILKGDARSQGAAMHHDGFSITAIPAVNLNASASLLKRCDVCFG